MWGAAAGMFPVAGKLRRFWNGMRPSHGSTGGVAQAPEPWDGLAVPQELRGLFLSHTFVVSVYVCVYACKIGL